MQFLPPEARPVRCARWSERDGVVVVVRKQPTIASLQGLKSWVAWAWHPKRIRLDELGSFVWHRLDGQTNVNQVAEDVRARFPDQGEDLDTRLAEFAWWLVSLDLIRIERELDC